MEQRSPWLDSSDFDQLSSFPPTTPGFSPSFVLPRLFLSGDSVSPSTLTKQDVRFIIDARIESPVRQLAADVSPVGVLFLDVEYRQGKFPCLTPAKVRVLPTIEKAFDLLLALSSDFEKLEGPRFVVLSIPAHDHENFRLDQYFAVAARCLEYALANVGVGVLVHCAAGVSRSPSLIAAFFAQRFKISSECAVQFLRSRRPMVWPNAGFTNQLKEWCAQFAPPVTLSGEGSHWEDLALQECEFCEE